MNKTTTTPKKKRTNAIGQPCLWVLDDGRAFFFPSMRAAAIELCCHYFSVYKAFTTGYRCRGGRVILDDGRPSMRHIPADIVNALPAGPDPHNYRPRFGTGKAPSKPRRRRSAARKAEASKVTATEARKVSATEATRNIWAERDAYLEQRRKMQAESQKDNPDYIEGPIASLPRISTKQANSDWQHYLNDKPSPEEQERIERMARVRSLPHTVGHYSPGFTPVICPVCGQFVRGVRPERHIFDELAKAVQEGREFAEYPGGTLRVTKEATGFMQKITKTII